MRRLQFSLRTLLMVIAIASCGMGYWAWYVKPKPYRPSAIWQFSPKDRFGQDPQPSRRKVVVELCYQEKLSMILYDTPPLGNLDYVEWDTADQRFKSTDLESIKKSTLPEMYQSLLDGAIGEGLIDPKTYLPPTGKDFSTTLYETRVVDWQKIRPKKITEFRSIFEATWQPYPAK